MSFYSNLKGLFTDTPISYAGKIPKGSKVVDGVRVMPAKIREIPLFQNPVTNAAMANVAALDASRYVPLGINLIQKAIGYKPAVQLSKEQLMEAQAKAMSQFDQPSVAEQVTDYIVNGRTAPTGFTGDYANAPIAARGATGSGSSVSVAPQTTQTPTATPQKTPSTSGKQSSGTGNAYKARVGNGRGVNDSYVFDPSVTIGATAPHYVGMSKGQLEGETPIAAAPEIFTGLPSAMQGNEYAQAAANGDMANAIAQQSVADAVAQQATQQAAQQSRYDQLMQDYALSQMADEEAIRRYMAQNPAQYGEDIGSLYDMLYGRN